MLDNRSNHSTTVLKSQAVQSNSNLLTFGGAFVYRLGHGPLKAERRVRFPYALPVPKCARFR